MPGLLTKEVVQNLFESNITKQTEHNILLDINQYTKHLDTVLLSFKNSLLLEAFRQSFTVKISFFPILSLLTFLTSAEARLSSSSTPTL